MRISLDEGKDKKRSRQEKRRDRRRPPGTFDAAIAQPQLQLGTGPRTKRSALRRSSTEAALPRTTRLPSLAPVGALVAWPLAWRRLPAVLVLLAVLGVMLYALLDSSFYVYGAEITGARYHDSSTILQAAGINEVHIFWVRPEEVKENILQLGGVKSVDVRCGLPAAIAIEIEEREPVVLWRATSQERDWWLDEEGVVLPYHGDAHSDKVVFVIDSSKRPLQAGETLKPAGIVPSAVRLAAALPGTRLFYFQEDRGLSFTQKGPKGEYPVYFGTSDDLARKIQVLQALNDYLAIRKIKPSYVDVRWADRPVYGKPGGKSRGGSQ